MTPNRIPAALALMAALLLGACSRPSEGFVPPAVAPLTAQNYALRALPAPEARIPVAVYDFPDLTGQFKERDNVQTLSRAVTQGGAPLLIKALQDAGERRWFTVLDRARLDDILKERQIVTEMRRLYLGEQRVAEGILPPLEHAGIIMQGGISGYDTNTMTGGIGARILGIGGDGKWQQDTVTVTLRVVSTKTGEVLASVTTHKVIASQALQAGAFRYVSIDKILEAEAGITQNEPRQIAVQQAIEKAVIAIVAEGAELGIWRFADPAAGAAVIAEYRQEKYGDDPPPTATSVPPPDTPDPIGAAAVSPPAAPAASASGPTPPGSNPVAPLPPPPPPEAGEVVGALPGSAWPV
ncbi:CsgG/HfaB family protein [Zavarzinia sp. CC-PAN008]|uniref:CsgG/HfaB family protein n=1 Tax=Zavarzinia sp. CC-PAN008 TaxID=3243332 RepID=UPI003F7427E5